SSVKDRFTLAGKQAIVTGAKGGIGKATATSFAELGANVAIVDLPAFIEESKVVAAEIANRYGVKTIAVGCDVTKEEDIKNMVKAVSDAFGTIDVVHSNAGIFVGNDHNNMPVEEFKKIIDINLTGMFMVNKECANLMIEHGHGGSIINTVSMSGTIINSTRLEKDYMVAYTASKGGAKHLTKGMAVNLIKHGIRVNSISPGYLISGAHKFMDQIEVDYWANSVPIKRFGDMDEITGIVCLLASDLGSYFVGSDILMDGGACIC
ncbi:SDR family oxidoreductase, partial [Lachnospiraceae bacterium OttesenSCG-928-J05]|nr:SDR family oxidoreductase [Lachnospiraceae bacterium OttesenSCG-928-J05]